MGVEAIGGGGWRRWGGWVGTGDSGGGELSDKIIYPKELPLKVNRQKNIKLKIENSPSILYEKSL